MKRKEKFVMMGKIVTVLAQAERTVSEGPPWIVAWKSVPLEKSRAGWCVGFTSRCDGQIHSGYQNSHDGDYEPAYFSPKKPAHLFMRVIYWFARDPVLVPLNAYTLGGEPRPDGYPWHEKHKQELREIMKDAKRDVRGRWI